MWRKERSQQLVSISTGDLVSRIIDWGLNKAMHAHVVYPPGLQPPPGQVCTLLTCNKMFFPCGMLLMHVQHIKIMIIRCMVLVLWLILLTLIDIYITVHCLLKRLIGNWNVFTVVLDNSDFIRWMSKHILPPLQIRCRFNFLLATFDYSSYLKN
jgi:hypothetical protein